MKSLIERAGIALLMLAMIGSSSPILHTENSQFLLEQDYNSPPIDIEADESSLTSFPTWEIHPPPSPPLARALNHRHSLYGLSAR